MNILQAMDDPKLFRPWFKNPATWVAWRAFLAALFALPMTAHELAIYRSCTGLLDPPSDPADEAWMPIGRRGGKSFIMALVAVFLACFREYRQHLQPGERATILVISADRRQARTIMRYVKAMLTRIPMLARMVESETAESVDLNNSVTIEVATASFRATRGYTVAACLGDEIAFWRTDDDAADPDFEILNAVRPAMATIPGAVMLCASSPYAKRGALYDAHRLYFGKPGRILVWKAPTRTMNPSIPQRLIDEALERDRAAASAEYLAEFRQDIASFVPREVVLACVDPLVLERAPAPDKRYVAFVDPSGGSADSMTLAVGHRDKSDAIVVDCLREIPAPFDPESAVSEFVGLLGTYSVREVSGDRYAGEWVSQSFEKRRIRYKKSELPKSGLYVDLLPRLMAKTIRLVDNVRLVNQLSSLERRTARGGKDSIDHPPGAHDDVANVVAGLASVASAPQHFASCEELRI
jgi:hypothetical protein